MSIAIPEEMALDLTEDMPAPPQPTQAKPVEPPRPAAPPSPGLLSPLTQESMADDQGEAPLRGPLVVVDQLLRDRAALMERIEANDGLLDIARVSLLVTVAGSAVFGAAIGMFRGGEQVLYAALKLPMAVILTAAVCTPAISALRSVFQRQLQVQRDVALVLTSLALSGLVMAGLAPVLPLVHSFQAGYHQMILLTVLCAGLAGLVGLHFFARGFTRWVRHERVTMALVLLTLFALVGSQMIWTLRPYVVRPRSEEIPFVRSLEGNFLDSVSTSARSMMGIYASSRSDSGDHGGYDGDGGRRRGSR